MNPEQNIPATQTVGVSSDRPPYVGLLEEPEELPRPLLLVFPPSLGEAETLRRMGAAMQELHATFVRKAAMASAAWERSRQAGDRLRQALLRGQALGYSGAAGYLVERVCEEFELWYQEEAAEPIPAAATARSAVDHGIDLDRPEFPLPVSDLPGDSTIGTTTGTTTPPVSTEPSQPGTCSGAAGGVGGNADGRLTGLVAVMRARRDQYLAHAVDFHGQAVDWKNDAPQGQEPSWPGRVG